MFFLFAIPLGLAASLRPDGFVSGAVRFVRRTLARSVFLGFPIGLKKVQKLSSQMERSYEEPRHPENPDEKAETKKSTTLLRSAATRRDLETAEKVAISRYDRRRYNRDLAVWTLAPMQTCTTHPRS